jgi:hypothetical protein
MYIVHTSVLIHVAMKPLGIIDKLDISNSPVGSLSCLYKSLMPS